MTVHLAPLPLDDLRHLDPAPRADLTSAQVARRDALLVRVTSAAHSLAPVPHRSRRRRIAMGLTATATLALVVALVVSAVPGLVRAPISSYALPAHGSLASWTPQSTAATYTPDEVNSCVSQLSFADSDQVPVVLTSDKRGDFTSLFVEQGDNDGYCVMAGGAVENWINFAGLASHPLDDANEAAISVMQGGSWMFVVSGHAGANVTSLTVNNPETGDNVTAAVAKGVWSAWWPVGPDSEAWKDGSHGENYMNDISISYLTADGASHQASSTSPSGDGDVYSVPAASPAVPVASPVLGSLLGWSAEATSLTPAASELDACGAAADGWPSGTASTVTADVRGDYHSLIVKGNGVEAYCVLENGAVQWSRDIGDVTLDAVAPGTAALAQMNGFDGIDGIDGSTRITEVQGYADVGVTSVTVHLAGGHDVQASVQNGQWMAWWPEDEPPALGGPTPSPTDSAAPVPAGLPSFSYTTSDGVTHDGL